jgi:hypothetical protein
MQRVLSVHTTAIGLLAALLHLAVLLGYALPGDTRVIRIVIDRVESPTFEGTSFGTTGAYERIVGRAFGEVDPTQPLNAIIQDLPHAPRNSRGAVEYQTDFYILKPVRLSAGNGLLLYDVANRGNKLAMSFSFNRQASGSNNPSTASDAGDGFLQRRGYTLVWSGWQADILPGANRLTIQVPVATDGQGVITGRVRAEYIVNTPMRTLNLSSGTYTGLTHASYETVSLDTSAASLTMRTREADPRRPIPSTAWAFADCGTVPFPGIPSTTKICLQEGFSPNAIYELLYTARDPLVLGLGFVAIRDLVSFLRYADRDSVGTPNPLAGGIRGAIMHGVSQGGRLVRSFLDLGFNEDESGHMVFEAMHPHLAAGRLSLNVRFGQPGVAYGQHENHLFPAYESPFTWIPMYDPVASRTAGLLERCYKSGTCPKIIQTVSSTEYWQGRMSLNTTDALGRQDTTVPDHVRIYLFSSTQHSPATVSPPGLCQQRNNPNAYHDSLRALLVALERWVIAGTPPPPSHYPLIRDGTLVPPDQESIGWPNLPGVKYTGGVNTLTLIHFGPDFHPRDESGIIAEPATTVPGRDYRLLVPRVDADGNEIAGIRSTTLWAPLGTYTGWNLRQVGFAKDELCRLLGMFIPFRKTRAERLAAGDPRLSLEERYGDHAGYVAAVRAAAGALVSQGFLLPEDAARLVSEAEASDVLR